MRRNVSRFSIYDSSIHVWRVEDADSNKSLDVLKRLLQTLRRNGWSIWRDPHIEENYKCLGKYHRRGRRGDLEMLAEASGCTLKVTFFQNVANVENPHGGQYDFGKLRKMPYLLRLRTQFELSALAAKALKLGFADESETIPSGAFGKMVHQRKRWTSSHPRMYSDGSELRCRNDIDHDGNHLTDGAWRCAYDFNGRLIRGQVYYDANNMWWLIPNDSILHKMGSFELFAFDTAKHPRRRRYADAEKRMRRSFSELIAAGKFAAAGRVVEALKKIGAEVEIEGSIKCKSTRRSCEA
jgi:hypothetical protein